MTETHELICIACPVGCRVKAITQGDKIVSIEGNQCKRGEVYVKDEIFRPTRVVTGTVRVRGGALPVLPVKTEEPVPKPSIPAILKEWSQLVVTAPIQFHQVIVADVAGTGVAAIASRPLSKQKADNKTA
ncbi:MAG TPA: DUF1667 domain-containing protein [bacterium]|jgi:CxxC motif-containing protein|nr:DUF1667 domain-containing protein [bacterium]